MENRSWADRAPHMSQSKLSIDRAPDGVRIHLSSPGATEDIVGRVLMYGGVVAFAIFALASSGFAFIAWIATLPFAIGGACFLLLMLIHARERIDIQVHGAEFAVTATALRARQIIQGGSATLVVAGPIGRGPRSDLWPLRLFKLRFSYADEEVDLGHGHSPATLRSLLQELRPYVGTIREFE